jgi:hypothetical protein
MIKHWRLKQSRLILVDIRVSAFLLMKVLITGICGFVGNLAHRIKDKFPGIEVFCIDNLMHPEARPIGG